MASGARFRTHTTGGTDGLGHAAADDRTAPTGVDPLDMTSLMDPRESRPTPGDGPFDLPAAGECLRLLEEAFVVALHDDIVAEIVALTADALGARDPAALIGAYARLASRCDRRAATHACAARPVCALCSRAPTTAQVAAALARLDALDQGLGARASIVDARRRAVTRALAQPDDVPAAVDAYRAYLHAAYATLHARYVAFWTLVVRQPVLSRASVDRSRRADQCASAPRWGGTRMLTPVGLAHALSALGQRAVARLLIAQQGMEPACAFDPPLSLLPSPGAAPMCRRWAALPEVDAVVRAVDIHERLAGAD